MLYLRVLLTDPFLVHTFFGVLRLCKGDLWQSLNNRHEESHSLDFLQARLPYRLSGKKHKLTFNQLLLWKKDESQNLFSCYFYNACTCVLIIMTGYIFLHHCILFVSIFRLRGLHARKSTTPNDIRYVYCPPEYIKLL